MGMTKPPEIGKTVKAYRIEKNITLSELSERSGVSKGMLSQIENGTANPTIATAWKISTALGFSLEEFLGDQKKGDRIEVIRRDDAYAFEGDKGAWKIRVISPPRLAEVLELYWVDIAKGGAIASKPHVRGTLEFATVITGEVEIVSGESKRRIGRGDTARYAADVDHAVTNVGPGPAEIYLVVKFD